MAKLNFYYVRNWTLKLDWQVFYMTIVPSFQCQDDSFRTSKMKDNQIVNQE